MLDLAGQLHCSSCDLDRIHEVTVAFDTGTLTCTTTLSDAHTRLSRAYDAAPPPRITHLDPT